MARYSPRLLSWHYIAKPDRYAPLNFLSSALNEYCNWKNLYLDLPASEIPAFQA